MSNVNEPDQTEEDSRKITDLVPNRIKTYKIIVVGDSNVGKTSLTYRFCEGKFLSTSEATIGVDFRERTVNVEGEDIKVNMLFIKVHLIFCTILS